MAIDGLGWFDLFTFLNLSSDFELFEGKNRSDSIIAVSSQPIAGM